jgi:WxL interacting protein linking bacterial and host surfaces
VTNRVRAAIVLAVLAVLVPLTHAMTAQAQPGPSNDGNRAWSARPATPQGQPDRRTHFTLQGAPGQPVLDQVLITNSSKVAAAFDVYATDAFNTPTGAFDLLPAAKKPTDIGSWVTFPKLPVEIAAGASITLQFQVTVPANATPGDHAGGVVVSLSTGTDVKLDSRVAVRLYLRVPGNLRPILSVSYFEPDYHGTSNPFGSGGVDVTYTVENTGNIRLQSHPKLIVKTALFGIVLAEAKLKDLPELLPGGKVTYTGHLDGVFPTGPETVTLELQTYADPEQPVGQAIPVFSGEATVWAVPWTLLLVILLLGGVGFLAVRFLRLRRSHNRERLDREVRRAREEALAGKGSGS